LNNVNEKNGNLGTVSGHKRNRLKNRHGGREVRAQKKRRCTSNSLFMTGQVLFTVASYPLKDSWGQVISQEKTREKGRKTLKGEENSTRVSEGT